MSNQPSDKRDRLKKLCNELRFNANHGPYVTKVSADLQHAAADAIEELQSAPSADSLKAAYHEGYADALKDKSAPSATGDTK